MLCRVDAGDRGSSLGRPRPHVLGQLGEPGGVRGDPLVVDQVVADDDVHHREDERGVGAGQRLDELVGGVGGDGAVRIDHHDARAGGAGLLDERPQVPVGQPGVGAPQDDQPSVAQLDRIERLGRCRW